MQIKVNTSKNTPIMILWLDFVEVNFCVCNCETERNPTDTIDYTALPGGGSGLVTALFYNFALTGPPLCTVSADQGEPPTIFCLHQ